jgi:hypothetical protein
VSWAVHWRPVHETGRPGRCDHLAEQLIFRNQRTSPQLRCPGKYQATPATARRPIELVSGAEVEMGSLIVFQAHTRNGVCGRFPAADWASPSWVPRYPRYLASYENAAA